MSLFPEGRISCCAFGYQAEAVLSDLCVTCTNVFQSPFISRTKNISNYGKTRLLFLLWGINGIRKTVKEMGFLVMKKWKEAKK